MTDITSYRIAGVTVGHLVTAGAANLLVGGVIMTFVAPQDNLEFWAGTVMIAFTLSLSQFMRSLKW